MKLLALLVCINAQGMPQLDSSASGSDAHVSSRANYEGSRHLVIEPSLSLLLGKGFQGAPEGAQFQGAQSQGSQSQGAQSQGAQSQGAQSQGAQGQGARQYDAQVSGQDLGGSRISQLNEFLPLGGDQSSQGAQSQGAPEGAQSQGAPEGAQSEGAQSQGAQSQGAQDQGAQGQGARQYDAQSEGAQSELGGGASGCFVSKEGVSDKPVADQDQWCAQNCVAGNEANCEMMCQPCPGGDGGADGAAPVDAPAAPAAPADAGTGMTCGEFEGDVGCEGPFLAFCQQNGRCLKRSSAATTVSTAAALVAPADSAAGSDTSKVAPVPPKQGQGFKVEDCPDCKTDGKNADGSLTASTTKSATVLIAGLSMIVVGIVAITLAVFAGRKPRGTATPSAIADIL